MADEEKKLLIEKIEQILKEDLKDRVRPEIIQNVVDQLPSQSVFELESLAEKRTRGYPVRIEYPSDIKLDEIVALGKKNIKTFTDSRGKAVELPVDELLKHREYDRFLQPRNSPQQMQQLFDSIKKEGIKEPLTLSIGPNITDRYEKPIDALLTEGNHRLAIAKALGLKTVPVKMDLNGNKPIKFPSIGKALGVAGTISDVADIAKGDIAEGALGLGSLVAGRASPYLGALRPEKTVSEELESRQLQEAKERQESEEEAKYKREALKRLMSSQED